MCKKLLIINFLVVIFSLVSQSWAFGKNKVQYSILNWQYISSAHFNLYFHQNQKALPQIAERWAEQDYKDLRLKFNFNTQDRIPLIVYNSPNLFEQTNIVNEILPEEVGGFTEMFKTRVVVPFNGSYKEFQHVLHHELTHAMVYRILYGQQGSSFFQSGIQAPLWFMEGLAEFMSSGWEPEADMFLMDQTINSDVSEPGAQLDGYMAYKGGQSFFNFLNSIKAESTFTNFLRDYKTTKNIDNSLKKTYGESLEELGKDWIQQLKQIYWPEIGRRTDPSTEAIPLTNHLKNRDNFNLRPKISPDGKRVAFFSDRKDYTCILITDRKGKVLQKISQNGYGGYFESFHPFRSGICWSPDGKSLAFVTKKEGKDELRILDIEKRKLKKTVQPGLSGISDPDWSHDGKSIVFAGLNNSCQDLFAYKIDNDTVIQLTNSIACESDPKFTRDDQGIICTIQDTNFSLKPSPYGKLRSDLALFDLKSKSIKYLTSTEWNEKQPSISPDGSKVVFVSDRNGIDNLYIGNIDSLEKARPLTDFIGGCSNPDWSQDSTVAFTLFQKSGWDIWTIDSPLSKLHSDTLANTRWVESFQDSTRHFFLHTQKAAKDTSKFKFPKLSIKPAKGKDASDKSETKPDSVSAKSDSARSTSDTIKISTKADTSKKASDNISKVVKEKSKTDSVSIDSLILKPPSAPAPYKLRFTPDMIALGVGVDTYYGYAGQWLLSLSDLLGDHQINLAGDVQGDFKNYLHLFASYYYLKQRVDIGGGAYFSRDYTYGDVFGDRIFHDTELGAFLSASYPFSMFSRIDFQLYARYLKREPASFDSLTTTIRMFVPSLSYSYDNILWGMTGPLNGIRASAVLQVSPPLDFVDNPFMSLDVDVRNYTHIASRFVWANRIFAGASIPLVNGVSPRHYFMGGNENWLFPKANIEKYNNNIPYTFYSDFVTPMRGWSYIDLTGTRAVLLNSEFRFPFVKELSVVWPVPFQIRYVNGAVFVDAGNAWDAGTKTGNLPLPDKIYGGIGFGLRANLGMFVLRFDRGWPTDFRDFVGIPINYFSLGAEF